MEDKNKFTLREELQRALSFLDSEFGYKGTTKGNIYTVLDNMEKRLKTMDQQDHDILIEIHQSVKHLIKNMDLHTSDDLDRFDKVDKVLNFQNKILYGAMGIVVFIEFVLKAVK